jgi:tritrans,polycis-undecaprenyl-diphosphate synthase [geranylgeranyl-diphosphate specific]
VPEHIAIIMDGNRRYANRVGKLTNYGHARGASVTEKVIEWSHEIGVKQLTVYAFSTENFNRSADEKQKLFELIGLKFDELCQDERTHKRKMHIRAIGDLQKLPASLQKSIKEAEKCTANYDRFYLNVAIAYGGRQDIVQAVSKIAEKVDTGQLDPEDITESTIANHLYPVVGNAVPNVDLIIRTGGDERVSNFLPWQTSGNECATYFCAPFWPEFRKIDFLRSIRIYQDRLLEKKRVMKKRNAILLKALEKNDAEKVHSCPANSVRGI